MKRRDAMNRSMDRAYPRRLRLGSDWRVERPMTPHADPAPDGAVRLLQGRFEARFQDVMTARAAARDCRAVGFIVDVHPDTSGWLAVGRRGLPFPSDERDRYASRFHTIASQHGGAFVQFVEELPQERIS